MVVAVEPDDALRPGQMTNGDPGTPGPQEMTSGPHKIHLGDQRVPLYFYLYYKNMHCRCNIFISFLVDRPFFSILLVFFHHCKAASTPKLQTLGEISPSSRANSCCIIIHWFLWKPSTSRATARREFAENSPREKSFAKCCKSAQIVLAANISLSTAVDTCSFC